MVMRYMAAFDVGGTKTDAILFDTTGQIIARKSAAGADDIRRAELPDKAMELQRNTLVYEIEAESLEKAISIFQDTEYFKIFSEEHIGSCVYTYYIDQDAIKRWG